ncbi:hypothetical protein DUI87_35531 [Hirundo rustica rustica]|uniref:Fibrinogen C-terminal domain-containing protein n=1 Tax=Hirundo rustica rustica TaxID=333673 RepID=A0A3M0J0E7_HIRRU|nr:hypothetical protein DUI87_35531 [Hirundo rustica rustica]
MTSQAEYSLRIDLEDWNNKHKHAFYQVFSIEDEENSYRLHVGGFSGTAADSFAWYHDKRSFSTPDSGGTSAPRSPTGAGGTTSASSATSTASTTRSQTTVTGILFFTCWEKNLGIA